MLTTIVIGYCHYQWKFLTQEYFWIGLCFPIAQKAGFVINAIIIILFLDMILLYAADRLSWFKFWREQVLFLHDHRFFLAHSSDQLEGKESAKQTFSFALRTLVVTMTWYMLRYDGSGTSKPQ
jgi:hypothetical protein